MANGNTTITVDAKLAQAYNAAPKATQKKLQAALRQALHNVSAPTGEILRLSKQETELFLRINRTLSEAQQQRYDELTEKRLAGALTKRDDAELEELIQAIERLGIDRLQAVIELARLRKVPPEEMLRQLELDELVQGSSRAS